MSRAYTDADYAALYAREGWKRLEMEEQAHARGLARKGYLLFNPLRLTDKAINELAQAVQSC